ncbi:Ham1-like protein [Candidatus Magnetoovum chiemensis]|nr:Ham1-like protein [Candidatus Magnetoovum chiemensis]
MKIVLATNNKGKIKEINRLFENTGIIFITLEQKIDPVEDGSTYEENALIKAAAYSASQSLPVCAEDSGLEVDALNKAPGIISARFAGQKATDKDNLDKLLYMMRNIDENKRGARFVSVFCLLENGKKNFFNGFVYGKIALEPKGSSGFGYDPVFIPNGYNEKTFAELGEDIKNSISHRAMAIKALKDYLLPRTKDSLKTNQ